MTHTYEVTGMTCRSCESKVKGNLLGLPDITSVEVSKDTNAATLFIDKHIPLNILQETIGGPTGKYQKSALRHSETLEQTRSWFETYKLILLIFFYITAVAGLINFYLIPEHGLHGFMQHFMAGFILVFSFFKLLNISGFADSYAMYDVIAKRIPVWGYEYAFTELALGIAYLINFNHFITNNHTNCNEHRHHWRFAKCAQQTKNSMCLFGGSFQFTNECRYNY